MKAIEYVLNEDEWQENLTIGTIYRLINKIEKVEPMGSNMRFRCSSDVWNILVTIKRMLVGHNRNNACNCCGEVMTGIREIKIHLGIANKNYFLGYEVIIDEDVETLIFGDDKNVQAKIVLE